MQLHCQSDNPALRSIRADSTPIHCPACGDWLVAPVSSEFVDGAEIRHHWKCEACGETSSTAIALGRL